MAYEESHSNAQRSEEGCLVFDSSEHHHRETQQDCGEHLNEAALCNTRTRSQANVDLHWTRECA